MCSRRPFDDGSPRLAATFDLVLGKTLEELEDGSLGGGVAMSEIQRRKL